MQKEKHKKILKHFEVKDPHIYEVMKNVNFDEWFKASQELKSENDYFYHVCREIVGQQLSGKAASTIFKRFSDLFSEAEDSKALDRGPSFKNKVTPENVLKMEDQRLRKTGMSWAKVRYIKDLAQKVKGKELKLGKLKDFEDTLVTEHLTKVKGIGKWTAEMFLMFTLKRENVFSFGDLGLRKGIEKVYKLKDPSNKQIKKIICKWEPYKTYGAIALWQSL